MSGLFWWSYSSFYKIYYTRYAGYNAERPWLTGNLRRARNGTNIEVYITHEKNFKIYPFTTYNHVIKPILLSLRNRWNYSELFCEHLVSKLIYKLGAHCFGYETNSISIIKLLKPIQSKLLTVGWLTIETFSLSKPQLNEVNKKMENWLTLVQMLTSYKQIKQTFRRVAIKRNSKHMKGIINPWGATNQMCRTASLVPTSNNSTTVLCSFLYWTVRGNVLSQNTSQFDFTRQKTGSCIHWL